MPETPPVGLITAMPEEAAALLAGLSGPIKIVEHGRRTFHTGTLAGTPVVLVVSRVGKVAAATTATELILRFNVGSLLLTGVAGGLGPDTHIGDIVIADRLIQHDMDASPIWPKRTIPLLDIETFHADPSLSAQLHAAAERFIAEGFDPAWLASDEPNSGAPRTPRVHRGLIVSGDQFVTETNAARAIMRDLPEARCVEMEGAAVAQVAHEYGVPLAVVRVISDRADDDATEHYTRSLGAFAAAYAHGVIDRHFGAL